MTRISRRTALIAAGAFLLSRRGHAADAEHALFWTVTPPGRKGAVLFGYERIVAALVPDIVGDGCMLADASERFVLDMPQDIRLPVFHLDRGETRPILQAVSPQTAERLRKFVAATPAASLADRLSGVETTTLLMGEGQHNPNGTVGGAIFDHARSVGKPVDQLLSDADMQSALRQTDLATLNNGIGEDSISHLLNLRDRIGPIGGYLEALYRQRKGEEIMRVTAEMSRRGVFSPSHLIETGRMQDLMFDRARDMLTRQADEPRFMLFPLGMLGGSSGLLARLKANGNAVAARA